MQPNPNHLLFICLDWVASPFTQRNVSGDMLVSCLGMKCIRKTEDSFLARGYGVLLLDAL